MQLFLTIKKEMLLAIMILMLLATSLIAQFPEGFEGGAIPASWTVHDGDGDGESFYAME